MGKLQNAEQCDSQPLPGVFQPGGERELGVRRGGQSRNGIGGDQECPHALEVPFHSRKKGKKGELTGGQGEVMKMPEKKGPVP